MNSLAQRLFGSVFGAAAASGDGEAAPDIGGSAGGCCWAIAAGVTAATASATINSATRCSLGIKRLHRWGAAIPAIRTISCIVTTRLWPSRVYSPYKPGETRAIVIAEGFS